MDMVPRNTPALLAKIDQMRNSLIKRFENLIEAAALDKTDRNTTALTQYQMQVEAAGLIRAAEDILTMTRQMQEMWLFGQLKTLETADTTRSKVDEDAKAIASLLWRLDQMQEGSQPTVSSS